MDIWVARRLARRAGAKLVYEVHDLWPLSPIELSGMPRWHPFIVLCQAAEDAGYRDADVVVRSGGLASRAAVDLQVSNYPFTRAAERARNRPAKSEREANRSSRWGLVRPLQREIPLSVLPPALSASDCTVTSWQTSCLVAGRGRGSDHRGPLPLTALSCFPSSFEV